MGHEATTIPASPDPAARTITCSQAIANNRHGCRVSPAREHPRSPDASPRDLLAHAASNRTGQLSLRHGPYAMSRHLLRTTIVRLLTVAAIASCATGTLRAQSDHTLLDDVAGTTFVVMFPDTTTNAIDPRFPDARFTDKCMLLLYSAVDSRVSITGRNYARTVEVAGGRGAVVDLMEDGAAALSPILTRHCAPSDMTFRIQATEPIVVYQYMVTRFGAEAWTPLPVAAWGNEYYVAAHEGERLVDIDRTGVDGYRGARRMASAEIAVVAAYDDTHITIVPNGQVNMNCQPTNITLRAGEAYSIQSYVDTLFFNEGTPQPDFGGSRVFATKPVGVVSGNTRAFLASVADERIVGTFFKNMLVEWIAPAEEHGREFVYLPPWDTFHASQVPGEDSTGKRSLDVVRVYATHPGQTGGSVLQAGVATPFASTIDQGKFLELRLRPDIARVISTDRPAQAVLSSAGLAYFAQTIPGNGRTGVEYDAIGGAMVTLAPREQWASFAPFVAPSWPVGMTHYIDVVTDSAHRNDIILDDAQPFVFEQRIEGTDLVWGAMRVPAGVQHRLEGRNGARFWGYVYGELPGAEALTYPSSASYSGALAVSYAYPLVSRSFVFGPGDTLSIDSVRECWPTYNQVTYSLESINGSPVGLRSVRIENAVNATIVRTTPSPLTGAIKAEVVVRSIDVDSDATGVLAITDKSGSVTRIPFAMTAERLELSASGIDFGTVDSGGSGAATLTLVNPTATTAELLSTRFRRGTGIFAVVQPPALPLPIGPGEPLTLRLEASPTVAGRTVIDTLELSFDCRVYTVELRVTTPATPLATLLEADASTSPALAEPNPFTTSTTLRYALSRAAHVTLELFDARGERIATLVDGDIAAGEHAVTVDGARLPAGAYRCRMTAGGRVSVISIVKVR
jgi:hypothetical protein